MTLRFDIRRETTDKWTVYDVFTEKPASVDGFDAILLEAAEARRIRDELNALEMKRRGSPNAIR
ncbi:hypothetical protein [Phyllobacterium bourgognense]|uniref:Uncharacterized protein n=1 Tax=Phyllobacterium bourgognense TaxID=314236 RepID=A0A368YKD1_9HYPH|nr:hypothetical protein [Phyllobacterium bourgognense]RCW78594.1 hypothetical protein C7476_12323 [Phyllobacterium bourgognense]